MTREQRLVANMLEAALSVASSIGVLDLMTGDMHPDSINEFVDTLERLLQQDIEHTS